METIVKSLAANFSSFAILKMSVKTPELKEKYRPLIQNHNKSLFSDSFPNSGFDLLVPTNTAVEADMKTKMIFMDVKCEMLFMGKYSCGYFMFPRSSISKSPLMLANHTGIIDSGYRGFLIGAFRNLSSQSFLVEENTRLLQVCHPLLCPIYVELVEEEDLSVSLRGEGGFGSTGK
jgi:dUTP pyrophosphatase